MSAATKFAVGICLLVFSFCMGFIYSNYHWNSSLGTIVTVPEQASVERALNYIETYQRGETDKAHKLMLDDALSDPEWNLHSLKNGDLWSQATNFPSFEGIERVRVRQLENIKVQQDQVRDQIGEGAQ